MPLISGERSPPPTLNPVRTHSKLKDLHFKSVPTPGPSDFSHSLSVCSVFHMLSIASHPPPPPPSTLLLFLLSSCQITSTKTGQWSLSARSQLCLCALNGRACLNVQWTLGVLSLSLSSSACVCVCVWCVGGCAYSLCISCITEWEDAAAHKGVQVVNLMNEHAVCV